MRLTLRATALALAVAAFAVPAVPAAAEPSIGTKCFIVPAVQVSDPVMTGQEYLCIPWPS